MRAREREGGWMFGHYPVRNACFLIIMECLHPSSQLSLQGIHTPEERRVKLITLLLMSGFCMALLLMCPHVIRFVLFLSYNEEATHMEIDGQS